MFSWVITSCNKANNHSLNRESAWLYPSELLLISKNGKCFTFAYPDFIFEESLTIMISESNYGTMLNETIQHDQLLTACADEIQSQSICKLIAKLWPRTGLWQARHISLASAVIITQNSKSSIQLNFFAWFTTVTGIFHLQIKP